MASWKKFWVGVIALQLLVIAYLGLQQDLLFFSTLSSGVFMGSDFELCSGEDVKITDEPYYPLQLYEPGDSWVENPRYEDIPPFEVEINSKGFRTDEFDEDPEDDVFRVVVIGDSVTFGQALNASDRYTEVAEEQLNEMHDKEVEVINLGRGGARMRSYFELLRLKAVDYEPDFVVVSFQHHDEISKEKTDDWLLNILDKHDLESEEDLKDNPAAEEEFENKHYEYLNEVTWRDSHIRQYGNLMENISKEEDFELLFYDLGPEWPQRYENNFEQWEEECGIDRIDTPENFTEYSQEEWAYSNGRQNPLANQWMGNQLAEEITERSDIG